MTARPGSLFKFAVPDIGDAEQILKWHISPRISAVMLSMVENDIERQRAWLTGVAARPDYFHWLIRLGGENIGIINITCLGDDIFTWGYYIGEETALGYGGLIPPYLYNYLFFERGAVKITGDVFPSNRVVVAMHRKHGYEELERSAWPEGAADPSDQRLRVALSREAWMERTFFHKYVARFS